MVSVHRKSKMYRTSAAPKIHAAVHFLQKSRVYDVHYAEEIYILLLIYIYRKYFQFQKISFNYA